MKASVVDLRYKMSDILKALERNEEVTVLYHGKIKGIIVPVKKDKSGRMEDHPFCGMLADDSNKPVNEVINDLRKVRYADI